MPCWDVVSALRGCGATEGRVWGCHFRNCIFILALREKMATLTFKSISTAVFVQNSHNSARAHQRMSFQDPRPQEPAAPRKSGSKPRYSDEDKAWIVGRMDAWNKEGAPTSKSPIQEIVDKLHCDRGYPSRIYRNWLQASSVKNNHILAKSLFSVLRSGRLSKGSSARRETGNK